MCETGTVRKGKSVAEVSYAAEGLRRGEVSSLCFFSLFSCISCLASSSSFLLSASERSTSPGLVITPKISPMPNRVLRAPKRGESFSSDKRFALALPSVEGECGASDTRFSETTRGRVEGARATVEKVCRADEQVFGRVRAGRSAMAEERAMRAKARGDSQLVTRSFVCTE